MFVLGLLLTGAVVAVLRFKRRLDDARRAEIERLRDAATRDSLTGLANHRAFHECLDGLVETGDRFSLAIVDLDGLKLTNDTCGHQAGDELLERLAHALADVSPDGRAFRIGGDEFAMVVDGDGGRRVRRRTGSPRCTSPVRPPASLSSGATRTSTA